MHLNDVDNIDNLTSVLSKTDSQRGFDESKYTVELITRIEEFDAIEAEWEKLTDQAPVHFFQKFLWMRTWWKHFGINDQLYIILIRHGQKLVGIAPLYLDGYSFMGIFHYSRLCMIGSTIPHRRVRLAYYYYGISDYLDFIVHPNHEEKVCDLLIDCLEDSLSRCDHIVIQDVPAHSFIMRFLKPEIDKKGWQYKNIISDKCYYIKFPDSLHDYLMKLDKKTRYKLRYSDRAVHEKKLFHLRNVTNEDEVEEVFPMFEKLHQQRWNNRGEVGAFADKRYSLFLKEVAKLAVKKKHLWMISAYDNEDCIAVDYAFHYKNHIYDYLKAFDDSHPLAKYRPGFAIQIEIFKRALNSNIPVYDFLRGDEKYKQKLTDSYEYNWNIIIESPYGINFVRKIYKKLDNFTFQIKKRKEQVLFIFHIGWEENRNNRISYFWFISKKISYEVLVKIYKKIRRSLRR